MLTTNQRMTQTLDPTAGEPGVLLASVPVTAPAYPVCATRPRVATTSTRRPISTTGLSNGSWSSIGLDVMPKVDFHDRWPLRSPS